MNAKMHITGCVMLSNGNLIIANYEKKYLIEYSYTGKHIRDIPVSGTPCCIAVIDPNRIVVTYPTSKFLEIMNNTTFQVEKRIGFQKTCLGVSHENGRLYVVCGHATIQVLDLSGRNLETLIITSNSVMNITTSRDRIFYTDYTSNKGHCCLMNGEELWQFESKNIRYPYGAAVDNSDNVYVVGSNSKNLTMIQHDGKDSKTLLTESDGLVNPKNVAEEGSDIGVLQILLEDECEDLRSEDCVPKEKDEVDSRFRPVENDEVAAQSKPYIPVNTIKKANLAKNMYNSWRLGAMLNAGEE
ncbi:unnamed protein product [Mytilus coruscus]|uniref:Uncharacterized protein n=1 Tax=Mytilus coruscus TaxID=42192 RepID=A0A6J8CIG5_MYTCO|nr:unnamed protein product [Mytilus coruscus]